MPYGRPERREVLDQAAVDAVFLAGDRPSAGDLNYVITRVVQNWVWSQHGGPPNYEVLNSAIGALEAAKLEFYRRVVEPYEDQKRSENGDVYGEASVEPRSEEPSEASGQGGVGLA